MRRIIVGLWLICLLLITGSSVTAQGGCINAASASRTKLGEVQAALAAGDTTGALALIAEIDNLLLSGCGDTTALAGESGAVVNAPNVTGGIVAFVRFTHTAIDIEAIDIYMESQGTMPVITGLKYGAYTDFVTIPAEAQSFVARIAGAAPDTPPLYRISANFTGNTSWIIYSAGVQSEQAFVLKTTSVIRSEYQNKTRLRIINLVRSPEPLGINTLGGVLSGVLDYDVSSDMMVEPGDYTVRAVNRAQAPVSADITLTLQANTTNTLLIVGSDDNTPAVQLLNITSPQEVGRVAFTSQRNEAVSIYYRPANIQLMGLLPANASVNSDAYITIPAGAVTFVAYAAGQGPGASELGSLPMLLRPGRDLLIQVTNEGMEVIQETLTPYGIHSAP